MTQKALRSKPKQKSVGALRKYVGEAKKKSTFTKRRPDSTGTANANYITGVENAMASRVPSDQSFKLTIVKPSGSIGMKAKNKKKPLTRGRTRKADRKK